MGQVETSDVIPADVSAKMDAAMASMGSTKHVSEVDAALDAAVDNVPEKYRANAGLGEKPAKKEQPKAAEPEQSEDEPAGDEGSEGSEPEKGAKPDAEPNYALEKALAALRLDGVPSETIDAMMANQAGRNQLLSWGAKVTAKHAATAEKLQNQAEELKRAQEAKNETPAKGEAKSPTPEADFTSSLEAFKEYGEEFQKGQSTLARAIHAESVRMARETVIAEIQPAAAMLLEMRTVLEEMVGETLDREARERFPGLVEGEGKTEAEAAFKRLWGKSGESYKDAAPTFLGRLRAARADAYKLVESKQPAPRKDDSQTKANRIPAPPSRSVPKKSLTVDQQVDAAIEESMKRYAER